jgi:hypothetical protein
MAFQIANAVAKPCRWTWTVEAAVTFVIVARVSILACRIAIAITNDVYLAPWSTFLALGHALTLSLQIVVMCIVTHTGAVKNITIIP